MRKLTILAAVLLFLSGLTMGGDYPNKEVRMIVPFAAGGGTDAVGRAIGALVEKELGKPVVVMNKTGGSGAVGMTEGAKSRPDGYTITMITRELCSLYQMNLSPVQPKDFEPICLVNEDPAVVLVPKNSPYKTIKDLIEAIKANPGSIKFASSARPNIYLLALMTELGVTVNQIPYNGAGESIPALLGGHCDMTMVNPGEAFAQIRAGELIPLAVCSEERFAGLPDVPTMREAGYDVIASTWRGIAVPLRTPQDVKAKLEAAFAKAVADPEFKKFMDERRLGIRFIPADKYMDFMKNDSQALSGIVKVILESQKEEKK